MARKKKKEEAKCETAGGLRWLITYADMITLLLGVFIILVSNSAIGESRYNAVRVAFSRIFSLFTGTREESIMPGPLGSVFPEKSGAQVEFPEEGYKVPVARGYKDEVTKERVKTIQTRKGMLFRLSDIMFEQGSARLSEKFSFELNRIGKFIEKIPNEIRIEGHTDANPIKTEEFSSNWELSIKRANAVREYFFKKAEKDLSPSSFEIYKKRFSIVGYGDSKPCVKDIYSPFNRRVDIVIVASPSSEVRNKILSE
ncbi:MAG: flagellar motor protein MotB [bacterium]